MKLWIDPPSGWKYGFPKVWDSEKDSRDIYKWMVENGYPQALIDELGDLFYTRQWRADDNSPSNP